MKLSDLEKLLAERFKNERKRLNLSAEDVAHFCQVSNSTVFNWESLKARIPLIAVTVLWRHGMDVEGLVQTDTSMSQLPIHPKEVGRTMNVPMHLLLRHKVYPETGFVYQCQDSIGDRLPAGELCLMQWSPNGRQSLVESDGLFLIRCNSRNIEVLCEMKVTGKKKVNLVLNVHKLSIGIKQFMEQFEVLGEYKASLGSRELAVEPENQNLRRFLELAKLIKAK